MNVRTYKYVLTLFNPSKNKLQQCYIEFDNNDPYLSYEDELAIAIGKLKTEEYAKILKTHHFVSLVSLS